MGLTRKQVLFVKAIAENDGRSATQCALDAGYSEFNAAQSASENMKNPQVQEAIEGRERQLAAAAGVDYDMVLESIRNLVAPKACRHCWGIDHKYQWIQREYDRKLADALSGGKIPEWLGGIGYTRTKPPHPDCPECNGDGINALKAADKLKGLEMLARATASFVDRQELSGPGGTPLQLQAVAKLPGEMSDEELDRACRANLAAKIASLGVAEGVSKGGEYLMLEGSTS